MTALRDVLTALPTSALVPAGWVLQLLDAAPSPASDAPDLDVAAFAKLMRRSPATIRGWLERGLVAGAFKLPGSNPRRCAWRIPLSAVQAFRERGSKPSAPHTVTTITEPQPSITDWRRVRRRSRR